MTLEEYKKKVISALDQEMAEMSKSFDDGKPFSSFDQGRSFEIGVVMGLLNKIIDDNKKCDTQGEF